MTQKKPNKKILAIMNEAHTDFEKGLKTHAFFVQMIKPSAMTWCKRPLQRPGSIFYAKVKSL